VVQDGTHRLDEVRRLEQTATGTPIRRWPLLKGVEHLRPRQAEALAALQTTYPALGALHRLKEAMRQWLPAPDHATAAAPLSRWLINAAAGDHAEGYAWAQTIKRWRSAVLARWELGRAVTNGFIEGGHTKIKAQKRLSYGFRHRDRYRRKIRRGVLPPTAIPPLLTSSPEGLDGLGASYYNNANLERQILASARSGGTEFWGESASAVGRPARIRQLTSSARGGLKVFVMSVPHFGKVKMGLGHFLRPPFTCPQLTNVSRSLVSRWRWRNGAAIVASFVIGGSAGAIFRRPSGWAPSLGAGNGAGRPARRLWH
jgi:hypothetical protein